MGYKLAKYTVLSCFILLHLLANSLANEDVNGYVYSEVISNVYSAGARIQVIGDVAGSVYLAGALIDIDAQINGNLYAAGSKVHLKGSVSGSSNIASADLKIDANIEGALKAAAASIEVSKDTKLADDSSLAAALIDYRGSAKDNLNLYAEEVVFSGQSTGSVTIEGHHIRLDETANIQGNLTIRSSMKAVISPDATIVGTLTQTDLEDSKLFKKRDDDPNGHGLLLLLCASVFILGLILIIFARNYVQQAIIITRTQSSNSLLWGFAVLFGLIIFIVVAMITMIGIPIGISVLLLLPFLLILGFTTATLGVSDWILNRHSESKNIGQRLIFLMIGIALLFIVGLIPLLGTLLLFLIMILGIGAIFGVLRHCSSDISAT